MITNRPTYSVKQSQPNQVTGKNGRQASTLKPPNTINHQDFGRVAVSKVKYSVDKAEKFKVSIENSHKWDVKIDADLIDDLSKLKEWWISRNLLDKP